MVYWIKAFDNDMLCMGMISFDYLNRMLFFPDPSYMPLDRALPEFKRGGVKMGWLNDFIRGMNGLPSEYHERKQAEYAEARHAQAKSIFHAAEQRAIRETSTLPQTLKAEGVVLVRDDEGITHLVDARTYHQETWKARDSMEQAEAETMGYRKLRSQEDV